jgi:transcriptional regulator with XRE-family HTH domain
MSNLGNKEIMSKNLRKFVDLNGKDRKDIAKDLNVSYSTFTDWLNGKTYPRIDKIEMMANYFKITKADLIEENNPFKGLGGLLNATEDDKELLDVFREIKSLTPEQLEKLKPIIKLIKSNLL